MKSDCFNLNIRYDLPDEIWDKVESIYAQMDGWMGYGRGGEFGEKNIPYWFGFDTTKKHISASSEPSGLQFCGLMEADDWIQWKAKIKNIATRKLGFRVGEIEEGEVGHYIEWL